MNDAPVGGYDPDSNPRSLRPVSDEAVEQYEQRLEQLKAEIDISNKQAGMFNSAGWRSMRHELETQIQFAVNAIASDQLNTMEAVCYVRGQIRAFQFLLAQEQLVVHRRQAAQEEIRLLRNTDAEDQSLSS